MNTNAKQCHTTRLQISAIAMQWRRAQGSANRCNATQNTTLSNAQPCNATQCTAMQSTAKQCKAGGEAAAGGDEAATAATCRPERPAGSGDGLRQGGDGGHMVA
eukprot:2581961-Pyramimonas_sp.AAC.2